MRDLRRQVAYVPQDAYLFDGPISVKYCLWEVGGNPREVMSAARAANAHGFILDQLIIARVKNRSVIALITTTGMMIIAMK